MSLDSRLGQRAAGPRFFVKIFCFPLHTYRCGGEKNGKRGGGLTYLTCSRSTIQQTSSHCSCSSALNLGHAIPLSVEEEQGGHSPHST